LADKFNDTKKIIIGVLLLLIAVLGSTIIYSGQLNVATSIIFDQNLSLRSIAKTNHIPVKEILHLLSHEDIRVWNLDRDVPIKDLSYSSERIEEALIHAKEETTPAKDMVRFVLWGALLFFVVSYLFENKQIFKIRYYMLIFVVVVFGVFLGSTPNPMESFVKAFKLINGLEGAPRIVFGSLIIFTAFSLASNKLICGWGCQFGALQDILYNNLYFKKIKKIKIPFYLSLITRSLFFLVFLSLLFGFLFGVKNFVLFHQLNPFKLFSLNLAPFAILTVPILLLISLFIYRPFCSFICPFGLYSWLLENFSLLKIKINMKNCIKCEKCVKECPTQAMEYIYNKKRKYFMPDCWSCGKCIDVCPKDVISFD